MGGVLRDVGWFFNVFWLLSNVNSVLSFENQALC